MRPSRSLFRPAIAVAIATALVATAGCSWFRKDNALYTAAPQDRPLEVPPDLDRPDTSAAMAVPSAGPTSVTRSTMAPAASAPSAQAGNGFTVSAPRDEVFGRIEPVLAGIEGVSVVSKAQLLGTYDIDAGDSKFLVRVSQADSGTYVSAVDPRGVAATGEDAVRVIEALRAALAE